MSGLLGELQTGACPGRLHGAGAEGALGADLVLRFRFLLARVHTEIGGDAEGFGIVGVIGEDGNSHTCPYVNGVAIHFERVIEQLR